MKEKVYTSKNPKDIFEYGFWRILYWGKDRKFIWGTKFPKDFKPNYWWRTWRIGSIELRHYWVYISHRKKEDDLKSNNA